MRWQATGVQWQATVCATVAGLFRQLAHLAEKCMSRTYGPPAAVSAPTQAYLKLLLFISAASFSNFSMTRLSMPPSL